jgi:hypothetical protein
MWNLNRNQKSPQTDFLDLRGFYITSIMTGRGLSLRLHYCLFEITEQILHIFQSYRDTNGFVGHVHFFAHLGGKCPEDGAGRVNGEAHIIEQVGGTFYQFQLIEERKAGFARL